MRPLEQRACQCAIYELRARKRITRLIDEPRRGGCPNRPRDPVAVTATAAT